MKMVPGRAGRWHVLWVLTLFSSGLLTPEGMKLPTKQFPKSSQISAQLRSKSAPAPKYRSSNFFSTESPSNSTLSAQLANITPKAKNSPNAHSTSPKAVSVNYTSVEHLNGNFTPTEHPRKKLIPTELSRGQSISTELPRGQSISTELPRGQSISTELPRGQSISTELLREQSISTELPRGQSISTELLRGESISTELPRGHSIPTELPRGYSIPTELIQRQSIKTELLRGQSIKTELPQGQSIPTKIHRGKSIPAERPRGKLILTELPQGKSTSTDRLRENLTTTDRPQEKFILTDRRRKSIPKELPQGTPIANAHPSGNLSSKELLDSVSRDLRIDTHGHNFRTGTPISRERPGDITISTNPPLKAETSAKIQRPTLQDQQNGSQYEERKPALLNAFEFAKGNADAGQLLLNTTEKHAGKLSSFPRAKNNDGEQKAKPRTVRETFEADPLYESKEFSDNIMLPSEVNERFEKWHQQNDVHGNAIGLDSHDHIFPDHKQKTVYARKLEYTLPSTYAVMVKKVYSSKQGLNSFPDDETPKQQTAEVPWFLEERETGNAEKIRPKGTSAENGNESVAEESNQTVQKVTKNSVKENSQATQHPFFDTHNENEFTLSDYEGLPSDWMFDNEIDSSWGQKETDELQKKPIQVNFTGSQPQRKNGVQVGDNKLHGNDHLHNSTLPTLKQDSSMHRRHRNAESSFTRAPTVHLLQNSGDRKFFNSIPLQSTSGEEKQKKILYPSLSAGSLISTDMLTDSSLQDIRVKMRKQLQIDNTKPKLNSIYNNKAKESVLEKEGKSNKDSRNPFFVSKQAGFRDEKLQDFIRHETKNEPPPASNDEPETLKSKHDRFSQNNERKPHLDNAKKAHEPKFTTSYKRTTESKPSREVSSYSSVPRFENSEENNLVGGYDERKENNAPRAEQSVRNDIDRKKYLNSRRKDGEDMTGPQQRRKVPIVKYSKQAHDSDRENLSYERPHRGNAPRDHPRGIAASNNSKKRNHSNELNQGPAADRIEPHGGKTLGGRGENIRRIDYDSDYVDYPQESRDNPKSNDDDGSKRHEDYDLYPVYDYNYQTESEDYPVVHDDYSDGPHESKRKYPNEKATDSPHDDRRTTTKEHKEPQQANYDRHASHSDRRDKNHRDNPHNHRNYNSVQEHAPKPQKQSSQPANDATSRDPPTLFDHAMQVAAATGKKLISPLLYLPDTQQFPEFERFGNFAKFKQ